MISLFLPEAAMSYEEVCQLPEPRYFSDLNLDRYVAEWADIYQTAELVPYFYCEARSYEIAKYRQEIVRDLLNPDIREAVQNFVAGINRAVAYRNNAELVESSMQSAKWNTDCIDLYYRTMENLCVAFNRTAPKSRAFYSLHQELFRLLNTSAVRRLRTSVQYLKEEFAKLRYRIVINNEKTTIDLMYSPADYCQPIREAFESTLGETGDTGEFKEMPFSGMNLSGLENFILKQLERENRQLFLQLHAFGERCGNVLSQDILDLLREIRFYMTNLEHMRKLEGFGLPIVMPLLVKDKELYLDDCYDLVLAFQNGPAGKEVVLNDIMKANFEKAVIVTGPNQGGKTTLARAFGQCVYFGMMGFPVPAGVCKLPYTTQIFTLFAGEEPGGVEDRLSAELVKVRDMLDTVDHRSVVILNELFTSAPTVDALAMSRDILKRLQENNAIVFFVTHTYEIALDSEDYVSLVATVVEDGSFRRTYRIIRKKADGMAYANSIVSKYKLDFSHINYRLQRKQE